MSNFDSGPKNDHKYFWTMHSRRKIFQYGISSNLVKRIIRFPDRKEEGIAPGTVAVMRRKNKKDPKKGEIWVMYKNSKKSSDSLADVNDDFQNDLPSKVKFRKLAEKLAGKGKIMIISVWIYPGESPKGKDFFVPDDVWIELAMLK